MCFTCIKLYFPPYHLHPTSSTRSLSKTRLSTNTNGPNDNWTVRGDLKPSIPILKGQWKNKRENSHKHTHTLNPPPSPTPDKNKKPTLHNQRKIWEKQNKKGAKGKTHTSLWWWRHLVWRTKDVNSYWKKEISRPPPSPPHPPKGQVGYQCMFWARYSTGAGRIVGLRCLFHLLIGHVRT